MKSIIIMFFVYCLFMYGLFFFVSLCQGVRDQSLDPWLNDCTKPIARIDYVLPAFRLGCWLGEVPK